MSTHSSEQDIYLYCDALLEERQAAMVAAHLLMCEQCRQLYTQALADKNLIVSSLVPGAEDDSLMYSKAVNKALDSIPVRDFVPSTLLLPFRHRGLAFAAVFVVVAAFSAPLFFGYFNLDINAFRKKIKLLGSHSEPLHYSSEKDTLDEAVRAFEMNEYACELALDKQDSGIAMESRTALSAENNSSNAALEQYAIAQNMIRRQHYSHALGVLGLYLEKYEENLDRVYFDIGYCYEKMNAFQDALAAYKVSMQKSGNADLKQEAHHRVNRILYRNLKEYDRSEISIKSYLDLYPDGKWREHQLFFLASLLKSRDRLPEYHATMHTFVTEFPDACVSVVYRQNYAERASKGN